MKAKLTLRHLQGSKSNQKETVLLHKEREVVLGRDMDCLIRFDETDELVSRKHAKIIATDEPVCRYMIVDLGSRNGTFVNRQRVFGAVLLRPGSRIQLGVGGPEFEVDLTARESRAKAFRGLNWKSAIWVATIVLAFCAVAYFSWKRVVPLWRKWNTARLSDEAKRKSAAASALASVLKIRVEWRVYEKHSHVPVTQAYVRNQRISHNTSIPLLEGGPARLPTFVLISNRTIQPVLVPQSSEFAANTLGSVWESVGVALSASNAVFTLEPDPKPWATPLQWLPSESAGALVISESMAAASGDSTRLVPLSVHQFPAWTTAAPGYFVEHPPSSFNETFDGRVLQDGDLEIKTDATALVNGQTQPVTLASERGGLWRVSFSSMPLALHGVDLTTSEADSSLPGQGKSVLVVDSRVHDAQITGTNHNGEIQLTAAACSAGGVVFDLQGRALALCAHSKHHLDIAIPFKYALHSAGAIRDHVARP
jgi:hypothetical protein